MTVKQGTVKIDQKKIEKKREESRFIAEIGRSACNFAWYLFFLLSYNWKITPRGEKCENFSEFSLCKQSVDS